MEGCAITRTIIGLFLIGVFIDKAESITAAVVRTCCEHGKDWYRVSEDECPVFDGNVASIPADKQAACRSIVSICCFKVMSRDRCLNGIELITATDRCSPRLRMRDGGYIIHECCHCCRIGLMTRSLEQTCTALIPLGKPCREAFLSCCLNEPFLVTPSSKPPVADVNECILYPNICSQRCINTHGSYRCDCFSGYTLNVDGNTCRAGSRNTTNSTSTQPVSPLCQFSPCAHLCEEDGNKVVCSCREGYQLKPDGTTCQDIDECLNDGQLCGIGQKCANTDGSFKCVSDFGPTCLQGYTYNVQLRRCDPDIVPLQCSDGFVFSSITGQCVRSMTECRNGYVYNATTAHCDDYDECVDPTGKDHRCDKPNERCRNTIGSYICVCKDGYQYDSQGEQCNDVNECAQNIDTCAHLQQCENTIGSFSCTRTISCGTGYTLNKDSQKCEDNDECTLSTSNCGLAFACTNIPGSFRCHPKECPRGTRLNLRTGECRPITCQTGFRPNRFGQCDDINECEEDPNPCSGPGQSTCTNSRGSYYCRQVLNCGPGYAVEGSQCVDVNECAKNLHNCKGNENCQNRPGTFICQCPRGYDKNHITEYCEDVNECERFRGQICTNTADCINTPGSYSCRCKKGFRNVENTNSCIDVNECVNEGTCAHHCVNSWGSFQCTCREGYELGPDQRSCQDIDECVAWGNSGRICPGLCENTLGTYRCSCPDGYTLQSDQKSCQDIDECQSGDDRCPGDEQVCFNTRGNHRCLSVACPSGYIRTPSSGTNNIRCQRAVFSCQEGDEQCLQSPLSFSYNFLTFPERIRIPADLFTMRGPASAIRRLDFELKLIGARDPFTGVSRVTREYFYLQRLSPHTAMIRLLRQIEAPQDVELELKMIIYDRTGREFGSAVAKIQIFVTRSLNSFQEF